MLIREYSNADKSELLQLVSEHLSPDRAEHLKEFWHWQLEENPYNPSHKPDIFLLEYEQEVVGALLSFSLPLKFDKDEVIVNCMMNFITHPEVRGSGIGLALKMSGLPQYFYGSPNRESHSMWQKLGSTDFCQLDSMTLITDMERLLRYKNINPYLSKLGGIAWYLLKGDFKLPDRFPGMPYVRTE